MFGGLIEITKECNEAFSFDISKQVWTNLRICPDTAIFVPEKESEIHSSSPGLRRGQSQLNRAEGSPISHYSGTRSRMGGPSVHSQRKLHTSHMTRRRQPMMSGTGLDIMMENTASEAGYRVLAQNPPYNPKPGPIPAPVSMSILMQEVYKRRRESKSVQGSRQGNSPDQKRPATAVKQPIIRKIDTKSASKSVAALS